MIRTNHTCETSKRYEKLYKAQCIVSDYHKLNQGTNMKDSHEAEIKSINDVAQQIDSMIDREEKAQKERLAQFDKIEKEIGDGVFELSELQDLARKHAALLPFSMSYLYNVIGKIDGGYLISDTVFSNNILEALEHAEDWASDHSAEIIHISKQELS